MDFATFIAAFITAIGIGSIIAAVVSHFTAISNFRQAWINALRDDLAEYFKSLETLNYAIQDFRKDSEKYEEKKRAARVAALFAYERIRLRLNQQESSHIDLEKKLSDFLNEPLGQMLSDRSSINQAVNSARHVLKAEWEVAKYPWRSWKLFK